MDDAQKRELTNRLIKRQLNLSLRIAAIFVVILVGLPLLNLFLPDLAATNIGGFSATWLVLGVLFYPLTWVLSSWFVKGSEKLEADIVAEESK
ncbi:MAG: hypothetical protein CBB60_008350 [Armatimonadetes bacterium Cent15-Ar3]|jgi:uncharacterized membrane protein (DUF485 family)|nr:MAG: hypothetical protein CBB60_008350 [Armatimonadetes bacterium Cent15-Ar3]